MKIAIIGLWHQGVVGAACLADLGYDVLAADHDGDRIKGLQEGKAPLFEPFLDDLIQKGLESGKLQFTTDVPGCVTERDYVLLMHDTPVNEKDESDLSSVFNAVEEIASHLEQGVTIYVTAQVPVGTCDRIAALIREKAPDLKFGIAYSPENLRLGQAIDRFMHPALPVIGADDPKTCDNVKKLLSPLDVEWKSVGLCTAEMSKHALNAFLATSVSFANELGNLCDEVGADGVELAKILRMEPRIGPKAMLFPGLGFSGGTLARDMQTLRKAGEQLGVDTLMLDGVWESNKRQNRVVIRKLKKIFDSLEGISVTVLGLTYKPDTSTLRRSAALEIIADLLKEKMVVTAHDPKADRAEVAKHTEFKFVEDVYEAVKGAQVVVIVTGWSDYKKLDFDKVKKSMAQPAIIDLNDMLDGDALTAKGFTYLDVGRGRQVRDQ